MGPMIDMLDGVRADVRDMKITFGPVVRIVAALEESVRDLGKRVA
jgi:hypothetical protein